MPDVHAKLSASGAYRWMACTPSAELESKFEDKSSPYAQEGTLAHSLAELKLRLANGEITKRQFSLKRNRLGEIPKDMDDYTDAYVDVVLERLNEARSYSPDATLMIEQRLNFSKYVPEGFGTGDAVIVSDHSIEVIDLKYGKGIQVFATENPQARLYAVGAYLEFSSLYDAQLVRSTIVQPRMDSISTEELTVTELLKWAEEVVKPKAALAINGDGEFHAGEHCRFCRAAQVCRARAEEALRLAQHEFQAPPILTDAEVEEILPQLDNLIAWANDIKEYAYNKALSGTKWNGFKLVEGRSSRKYTDEAKVAEVLTAAGLDEDAIYTKKLNTITAMEKALGRERFEDLLGDLVVKPRGNPTLVSAEDKRTEISSAELDFG